MHKDLEICGCLMPGEPGTEELVEQYGDALICVRYRFDEARGVMLKTAEVLDIARPLHRRKPGSQKKRGGRR